MREILQATGVKGLEADTAHTWGQSLVSASRDTRHPPTQVQHAAKATLQRDCRDVFLVSNPETEFAIIISAVSNISGVTAQ